MTPPDPSLTLGDGVVTLRSSEERDLPAIEDGMHDPDVVRWIGPPDSSATIVLLLNRRRWADGSPTFSICQQDDACIGLVWINLKDDDPTIASVGYWLLPTARGHGLATRAVRLISQWAVRYHGIERLRLRTESANEPSQRVAERSGFRRIGTLTAPGQDGGRSVDHVLYELPPGGDRNGESAASLT